ncbi:MAG: hypothetical protein PHU25_16700 [Deltaproteobacteria bacterium]|nr:hypothetical protein [Deltaproteobacteria bacterium]
MKTAISVPDPLFREADALARKLSKSRSQLYAEALEAFVTEYRADRVREALDAVYGSEPSALDPQLDAMQRDALRNERR